MGNNIFTSIPVSLYASFFYDSKLYTGIVKTVSENNMFISTSMDFPCSSKLELHIPFREAILKIPVRVKRFIRSNDSYNGVDVEVLEPDIRYLEFVGRLKSISAP